MDFRLSQIRWLSTARGLFKNLPTFDKKRHSPPSAATPAAAAFLAKLCEPQLAEETEAFFQRARSALNYKRKEISLTAGDGVGVLKTKDFFLEWEYAVAPEEASEWLLTRTLHGIRNGDFLALAEFNDLFEGAAGFSTLEFYLGKPVRIEDVIDVVETLGETQADGGDAAPNTALRVEYPSDCSRCVLRVEGVAAEVVFTGATLRMEFPDLNTPQNLAAEFLRVREAFGLSKSEILNNLGR